MVARIFLDIDDTLTDFRAQAKRQGYGKPIEKGKLCADAELWEIINRDACGFAATMEWEKIGFELYARLIKLPFPIIPITHYPCEQWKKGRLFWIERNLPMAEKPIMVPSGNSKADFCEGKSDILIDDMPFNVEEWREKGGTAVLWNSEKPGKSFSDLNFALKNLEA